MLFERKKTFKPQDAVMTNIVTHCGDCDIESSYPWTGIFGNISRLTTEIEVSQIHGRSRSERYTFGLGLMGGKVNSMSNARIGFRLPDFAETQEVFDDTFEQFLKEK